MPHPGGKSVRVLTAPVAKLSQQKGAAKQQVRRQTLPAKPSQKKLLNPFAQEKTVRKVVIAKKRCVTDSSPKNPVVAKRRSIQSREVSVEAMDLARTSGLTKLEQRSVSVAVENQYANFYQKFQNFCRDAGRPRPSEGQLDGLLADYMDKLFMDGRHVAEGEKTLASVEYHHVRVKGRLVRGRRALRGWRKEKPQQSRVPIPKILAYGISMQLIAKGFKTMGIKVILDFDTYMRPGESIDLKVRHLILPVKGAGAMYKWHTLVVRDFDDEKPDKVGVYDNSIPLNSTERLWLGDVLEVHAKGLKDPEAFMFQFKMDDYRKRFNQAAKDLGLSTLHPYQLRHGGAADDLAAKFRDHAGVKSRGRWETDQSVRRYTKIGKVQQLLTRLSPGGLEFCRWSHQNLEKVLRQTALARKL